MILIYDFDIGFVLGRTAASCLKVNIVIYDSDIISTILCRSLKKLNVMVIGF
jgi:hypothetical protein